MTAPSDTEYPSLDERRARGAHAHAAAPPEGLAGWRPDDGRRDPVDVVDEQNRTRDADLVPLRHARMQVSPFTFFRGAARVMAHDLATTPTSGLTVQLCGDAHLSNFGLYASPERSLVFDLNDFDETLPGPFEYDVLRMATSFTIAARTNGFDKAEVRDATRASVRAYRKAMYSFAQMRTLDLWYSHLSEATLRAGLAAAASRLRGRDGRQLSKAVRRAEEIARKARTRDSLQALAKLGEVVDGRYRIVSRPPILVPLRDYEELVGIAPDAIAEGVRSQLDAYRRTLPSDRRHLLEQFELVDVARKVVGVGSVGTRSFVALLQGRDARDPLFLQIKEATTSVLEDHLPASATPHHGERVVQGQRLMQATSDIFLGWTTGFDTSRHYYWRQLRDMKGSVDPVQLRPAGLTYYAGLCGWTLARAHARSGDPVAIAEYLGAGGEHPGSRSEFDDAVVEHARRYARLNDRDHAAFVEAVASGRIEASDVEVGVRQAG